MLSAAGGRERHSSPHFHQRWQSARTWSAEHPLEPPGAPPRRGIHASTRPGVPDSGSVRALRRLPPAYRSTRVFEHAFGKPVSLTLVRTFGLHFSVCPNGVVVSDPVSLSRCSSSGVITASSQRSPANAWIDSTFSQTVTYRYSVEDGSRGLPTCCAISPDCCDTSGKGGETTRIHSLCPDRWSA
jgi:hypothetical protein